MGLGGKLCGIVCQEAATKSRSQLSQAYVLRSEPSPRSSIPSQPVFKAQRRYTVRRGKTVGVEPAPHLENPGPPDVTLGGREASLPRVAVGMLVLRRAHAYAREPI